MKHIVFEGATNTEILELLKIRLEVLKLVVNEHLGHANIAARKDLFMEYLQWITPKTIDPAEPTTQD